ncbi:4-carboxymuconolactone decarboxylase [Aulographum hederae CBS 113979]|uniref:4-carboxymuconolactone decarboxylase n=1 Tax=Aulographum hederae CBS 113979 TaxID=1176131 RepID=A0A6G1GTN6_9PEZI|nr:4-carboxymuconolactone decarboxylase [Aulographum hederae CBS 113979]
MSTDSSPTPEQIAEAQKTLYAAGLAIRQQVAGKPYVDRALSNGSSSFAKPMQDYVTSSCWGSIWTRPGLSLQQRSLLNIAMLCALNRSTELGVHVRGAMNNGCSEVEVRETILQAAVYCGAPAGMEGTRVAEGVIGEWRREREGQEEGK